RRSRRPPQRDPGPSGAGLAPAPGRDDRHPQGAARGAPARKPQGPRPRPHRSRPRHPRRRVSAPKSPEPAGDAVVPWYDSGAHVGERLMNVGEAATVAKQHLTALFAETSVKDFRLEEFLWDDHLGFWTLTLGYTPSEGPRAYK